MSNRCDISDSNNQDATLSHGLDPSKLTTEQKKNNLRVQHFFEIIKHGEHQFSLIQAFLAYCRLRLERTSQDVFIDPTMCVTASEVLPIAVRATLTEIEEAEQNLSNLKELILRNRKNRMTTKFTKFGSLLGELA